MLFNRSSPVPDEPMDRALRELVEASPTGCITFAEFMRLALYEPEHGYYARHGLDVGQYGAFYRDPMVSAIFAQSMAAQFEQMWSLLGRPAEFTIVEQGAGNARFSIELLTWLSQWRPEMFGGLRYVIIEPVPSLQQGQKARVKEAGLEPHFAWAASMEELAGSGAVGVFYSCEYVDSLPTRLVSYLDGWQEMMVAFPREGSQPHFQPQPVQDEALLAEIERWQIPRVRRYRAEVCMELPVWTGAIAKMFDHGFVLTIAHGFDSGTLYHTNRINGSIHTLQEGSAVRGADLLAEAGMRDISYMVNFSALREHGAAAGLDTVGLARQVDVMHTLARPAYLAFSEQNQSRENDEEVVNLIKAFRTLIQPPITAGSYRFLIQAIGLDLGPTPHETYPIAALARRRE